MIPKEVFFEMTLPVAQHVDTSGQVIAERPAPERLSFIVIGAMVAVVGPPVVNMASGPEVVVEEFSATSCT
jgi:hypothetical protein